MPNHIFKYCCILLLSLLFSCKNKVVNVQIVPKADTCSTCPTMADYWNGNADWQLYYNRPVSNWHAAAGTTLRVVNGTWYWFQRYQVDGQAQLGTECRKSDDKGQTWSKPVKVINPTPGTPWSRMATDGDFYYDAAANKWRCLFQSLSVAGGGWTCSYFERAGADPMGPFTTPSGFTNPAIYATEIWSRIPVKIAGRVYDEGTPEIVLQSGSVFYVTFHGVVRPGPSYPYHGFRGIATTTDFQTYTPAASGSIMDEDDTNQWDVDWQGDLNGNAGSIGVGAATCFKEGAYWYTLIEGADKSLGGTAGQNWTFGLLRSTNLTSTNWENWPGNPVPTFAPHKESLEWQYARLFKDGGVTYCAMNKANPASDRSFRIYKLEWKSTADPLVLDRCDSQASWSGTDSITLDTWNKKEGAACLTSTGSGAEWFKNSFSTHYDSGVNEARGFLQIHLYVSDVTKFDGDGQIEIGSSPYKNYSDVSKYKWSMAEIKLINGWNTIDLKLSSASRMGSPDLTKICWFRVYHPLSDNITRKIDNINFHY